MVVLVLRPAQLCLTLYLPNPPFPTSGLPLQVCGTDLLRRL